MVWLLFLYKGVVGLVATWVCPVAPAIAIALPLFFIVSYFTKKPPGSVRSTRLTLFLFPSLG